MLDSGRTAPSSSAVIAECEQVVANLEDNEYLSLWKMWTHMAEDTTLCDHRILAYIILNTDINEVTVFLREQRRLELQSQETLLSVSIHLWPAYDEQNSNFVESEYQRRRSHWIQRWIYSRADDFVCVLTAYVVAKKMFLSAFNAWLNCQRSRSSMEPIIQVFKCALKKKDDCMDYALWLHSHLHSPNPVLALQMFHEACEIEWLFFDGECICTARNTL